MRGRTLRLDPADPEKLASNWDVVCVAPDLVRGTADYERFVRKHLHLFAPAEDGEIEAGPSHVHPEMGPFAPPPVEHFAAFNAAQLARASDRAAARELWQVGTPYRGVELPTLLVRPSRPDVPAPAVGGSSRGVQLSQKVPIAGGVGGAAVFGGARAGDRHAGRARRPRARPARPGLGRVPAGRREEAAAARAPARRRRPRRRRGLPGAGRALARGRRLAHDRAARGRLPALSS